jgi:bacterioferritin (cytochrome b1)
MSEWTDKLNEILGHEWACVRTLRRAEETCTEPGPLEVIKRVRKDSSVNCAALANVIRSLGGRPTDIPNPRFSLKLSGETVAEILDLAQSAQRHIVDELEILIGEPELRDVHAALSHARQLHKDNIRWLQSIIEGNL